MKPSPLRWPAMLALLSPALSALALDVVNNLTTTATVNEDLATSSIAAGHCFITGGQELLLTSASAILQRASGNAQAEFSIRANNSALNRPGAVVATLGTTAVFTDTGVKTVNGTGHVLLNANTRYWLVVKNVAGNFNWLITTSPANSGVGTLLDVESRSLDGGVTWVEANVPDDYHQFSVVGTVPSYDFGDAPDASNGTGTGDYQTRLADNGPRHIIGGCYLGVPPDSEADGQPTAQADGDDLAGTNDEDFFDGIGFFDRNMVRGLDMGLLVDAHCPAGQPARIFVKGWADWNQNGAFEAAEVIYQGDSGSAVQDFVPENLTITVPANAVPGPTFVRFRTATSAIADPTGLMTSGEVQDVRIHVFQESQYLTVNTEADEFDTPSGPNLSLREAIRDTLPFAYNFINFSPGVRAITLARGELPVSARNVEIAADHARPVTVDGNQASRIFTFDRECVAALSNLVIRNGRAPARGHGGGILNNGSLSLESCRVENNRSGDGMDAVEPSAGGNGGGIHNSGRLSMNKCHVTGNQTGRGGNALGANQDGERSGGGGGIYNHGTLTLTDCSVANNSIGQGGNATPGGSGGGETGDGGGVRSDGPFFAYRCSFTGNHADQRGLDGNGLASNYGAVGGGILSTVTMELVNCTIAGNISNNTRYGGGGIALFFSTAILRNCTVAGNTTIGPGGGIYSHEVLTTLSLENCVVANNSTPDSAKDLSISQNLASLGVNLIGNSTGATGLQPEDLVNQDPILLPLGMYGGVGLTAPPGTGSPLLHAGTTTNDSPIEDQRGVPRASAGELDIGAVELGEFNRAANAPAGYENAADITRPHDSTAAVSYEANPANPPSPAGEEADKAIDNLSNAGDFTKFLAWDGDGSGLDIRLHFAPVRLSGITLKSANDGDHRDPAHFILLAKNVRGEFDLVAEGTVPAFSGRFVRQTFHFDAPTAPATEFRLLFPTVLNNFSDGLMQIGEVELLGLAADPTLRFVDTRLSGNQVRATCVTQPGKTYRILSSTDGVNYTVANTGVPANAGRQASLSSLPHVLLKVEEE